MESLSARVGPGTAFRGLLRADTPCSGVTFDDTDAVASGSPVSGCGRLGLDMERIRLARVRMGVEFGRKRRETWYTNPPSTWMIEVVRHLNGGLGKTFRLV